MNLYDHESERALIGAALVSSRVVVEVGHLAPEDFHDTAHGLIWKAMQGLGSSFEPIQVKARLSELGGGAKASEVLRVAEEEALSAAGAPAYAQTIRERAQRRKLADAADRIRTLATSSEHTTSEAVAEAEAALLDVSTTGATSEPLPLSGAVAQYLRVMQATKDGDGIVGLATGIGGVDRAAKGLRSGEILVIAGRPGMGKSTVADQIAMHVAGQGIGVLIFNLEMSAHELPARPIARMTKHTERDALEWIKSPHGQSEYVRACARLSDLPVWIDDRPGQTIAEIRAQARRWKLRHPGIGLLVIDYLQLVAAGKKCGSRSEEVAHVSRGVKILAKELAVPVLLLSQVNRELDKENRRPRLADLRESAAVEQDADMVLFIHGAAEEAEKGIDGDALKVELLLAKCRRGQTGLTPMWFRRAWSRFDDRTPDPETPPEAQPSRPFAGRKRWQP